MDKIDKLINQAQEHLNDGEIVNAVIMGAYEGESFGVKIKRQGIFMATGNRLVFFAKRLTGFDLESFPYSNISSIEMSKKVMGHKISFFSSGNKVSMEWIKVHRKKDINGFLEYVRSNMGKGNKDTLNQDDIPAQIKKLHELNEQGILTDEEFESKKQELLKKL